MLHNAFAAILREIKRNKYGAEKITYPWMKSIVINHCLDWLRKGKRGPLFPDLKDSSIDCEKPGLNAKRITEIPNGIIDSFIQQLPVGYRVVFNLHCFEYYTFERIDECLCLEPGTSKIQFHRAKILLARKIKTYLANLGE